MGSFKSIPQQQLTPSEGEEDARPRCVGRAARVKRGSSHPGCATCPERVGAIVVFRVQVGTSSSLVTEEPVPLAHIPVVEKGHHGSGLWAKGVGRWPACSLRWFCAMKSERKRHGLSVRPAPFSEEKWCFLAVLMFICSKYLLVCCGSSKSSICRGSFVKGGFCCVASKCWPSWCPPRPGISVKCGDYCFFGTVTLLVPSELGRVVQALLWKEWGKSY